MNELGGVELHASCVRGASGTRRLETEAGQAEGLSKDMALQIAKQTVFGSAALAKQADEPPEELRNQVTSKGGTTQAGLEAMAASDFRKLIHNTVRAAKERSIEMGKE